MTEIGLIVTVGMLLTLAVGVVIGWVAALAVFYPKVGRYDVEPYGTGGPAPVMVEDDDVEMHGGAGGSGPPRHVTLYEYPAGVTFIRPSEYPFGNIVRIGHGGGGGPDGPLPPTPPEASEE